MSHLRAHRYFASLLLAFGFAACGKSEPPRESELPANRFTIAVAPLSFPGVSDITYSLSVTNALDEVVWTEEALSAAAYGNGTALTFIGACDASDDANPNTVSLSLLEMLDGMGKTIPKETYLNPTASEPIQLAVDCIENADTLVEFNLTIMRSAHQGFFDIGVTFEDIYCSAKFDCGTPGARRNLLFPVDGGARIPTAVLGFACTGGPGAETLLWFDEVQVDCGDTVATVDLRSGPGNHYPVGGELYPPAPFGQIASYTGVEQLSQGQESLGKIYFNMAFGLDVSRITADCQLTLTASASDGDFGWGEAVSAAGLGAAQGAYEAAEDFKAGAFPWATPPNTIYPLIRWNIDLVDVSTNDFACGVHPLDDPTAPPGTGVYTDYTEIDHPQLFSYRVGAQVGDDEQVDVHVDARQPDLVATSRIVVRILEDSDNDGIAEPGEPPVAGVPLNFKLLGTSSSWTSWGDGDYFKSTAKASMHSFVTNANGEVSLWVPEGSWSVSYSLGHLESMGFVVLWAEKERLINVLPGESETVTFSFVRGGTVTGLVFGDLDRDGIMDGGEGPLADISVELTAQIPGSNNGESESYTFYATTDADGLYELVGLPAGTHTLNAYVNDTQAGWMWVEGVPLPVTVTLGQTTTMPPLAAEQGARITGQLFADGDWNGQLDEGEGFDSSIVDDDPIEVRLVHPVGNLVETVLVDANGYFQFNVEGGEGWKVVVPHAQAALDRFEGFSTSVGGLADTDAEFDIPDLLIGDVAEVAVGLKSPGRVNGEIFVDSNPNGIRDNDETLAWESIPLWLVDSDSEEILYTVWSNYNGTFSFAHIPPGDYEVRVDALASNFSSHYFAVTTLFTSVTHALAGLPPYASQAPAIGVEPLGTFSLKVYVDLNLDGVQSDYSEHDIPGIDFTLSEVNDRAPAFEGTTGQYGYFSGKIRGGTWSVDIDPQQEAMTGYVLVDSPEEISLTPAGSTPTSIRVVENGEVNGRVFLAGDSSDLFFDGDESTLAGVLITFESENEPREVLTDSHGRFLVALAPGVWTVDVPAEQGILAQYSTQNLPLTIVVGSGGVIEIDIALTVE